MNINSISDFRQAIRNGAYAWPGGYPIYFVTSDGAALSFDAAKQERRNVLWSIANSVDDGWRIIAVDINYEDTALICDHTGQSIECAYGE